MHHFDEINDLTIGITNRRQLNIDVFFTAWRLMQMQHPLRPSAGRSVFQRARLANLIARPGVVM
jgi:hypothetical protein